MNANSFLLSSALTRERLSWIEECLKFFFVQLYPETLIHQKSASTPVFIFFITGDALYSLSDQELLQIWNIILSFSPVQLVCDRIELEMRGISAGPLKMKFPDQVIDTTGKGTDGRYGFWKELTAATRMSKSPLPGSAGWLEINSPYMYRSAWHGFGFLSAALDENLSPDFYAYMDGIHCGHHNQHPTDAGSVGDAIVTLSERAASAGMQFHAIGTARSATDRGYSTWNDGQGQVISTCTIRPFRIREISQIIERFRIPHPILSADAGVLMMRNQPAAPSFDRAEKASKAPPITILITKSPYSTGHAHGAIAFAVACAHEGILTRVIFIEDGIYCLTGSHRLPDNAPSTGIQDLINVIAGSENLHFFAFTPSFQKRGIGKDRSLNAVLEIGYPGLGKIFFYPPGNVQAGHQRIFFF